MPNPRGESVSGGEFPYEMSEWTLIMKLEQVSEKEVAFLVKASESNLLAFMPADDLMIISFIERGFIENKSDVLMLTEQGRALANVAQQKRECAPT